jgi:thiol-disulfide isomerase/thioredoxin
MNKLSAWWEAYKKKETIWGHISNVIFILFVIAMIFPTSRQVVSSTLIKLTLFDRGEIDPIENPVKLSGADWGIPFYKDGEALPLGAYSGQVIVINYWATWCPPCIAEMPNFQSLYDRYGDEVQFIFATSDNVDKVEAFMTKHGYELPVYYYEYLPVAFNHSSIPTTFIVNRKGEIVFEKVGAYKWDGDSVEEFLDTLISE